MRTPVLATCLLILLPTAGAGCRVAPRDVRAAFDDEALQPLVLKLKNGQWRRNRDWKPLGAKHHRNESSLGGGRRRWSFVSGTAPVEDSDDSAAAANDGGSREESRSLDEVIADLQGDRARRQPDTPQAAEPDTEAGASKATSSTPQQKSAGSDSSPEAEGAKSSKPSRRPNRQNDEEDTASPPGRPWDGFWPLDVNKVLNRFDGAGDAGRDGPPLVALARRDGFVGWNAAILQARRNPRSSTAVLDVLEELVKRPPQYDPDTKQRAGSTKDGSRSIPLSMRAAAAEAWCLALAGTGNDPIETLAPAGRLLEKADLPVALRGELLRGVARRIAPARIPRLANAFRESEEGHRPPTEIRRAAIEACLMHAVWNGPPVSSEDADKKPKPVVDTSAWPATIWNCRWDPDPHVRRTFGQWLAVGRHPRAFSILKSQLADTDIEVRKHALVSLGLLETDAARDELLRQAGRREEIVRASAVKSLARWGADAIARFVDDEAYIVRRSMAEGLAGRPNLSSARLLRRLLLDPNPEVQSAVVEALRDWPDKFAIPLLLVGLQDSSLATRRQCIRQLRRRADIGRTFDMTAPREKRAREVRKLAQTHDLATGLWDRLDGRGDSRQPQTSRLRALEIETHLDGVFNHAPQSPAHRAALEHLRQLQPEDVAVVERYLEQKSGKRAEVIYRDVLPALDPAYAALRQVDSEDVFTRRRGAQRLAELAGSKTLSRLVVRRLRRALVNEQDRLVWRYAMQAVRRDGTDEAAQIALLAVNHTWADIRLLGCRYVARHGRPEHALWLLPLFRDPNEAVQLAAVKAAGRCHNPVVLDGLDAENSDGDRPGLRTLLIEANDGELRFAAAVSMSRLGDRQGMDELVRLSYRKSALRREEAVRAMGRTGRTRFVRHLVRLAWTERNDRIKQVILESLHQLVPEEQQPAGLEKTTGTDERIEIWVDWWEGKKQTAHQNERAGSQ